MAEHYYTIKDIEEMTGIPATAIRFYDKRGLLVFVKRSPNGMRIFTDRDVEKIRLIQLLRNLDMPVNVISRYIGLVQQGDASRPSAPDDRLAYRGAGGSSARSAGGSRSGEMRRGSAC